MTSNHASGSTPPIYANDDTPPGLEVKAHPVRVAVGALGEGATVEGVARHLVAHGVPEDRIHFLYGDDGCEFLDNLGNWFTRAMSEQWETAKEHLDAGETVVSVFDVDDDDVGRIRGLLEEAGIAHASYYGEWTNLE
jgi:hypothetical protein